MKNILLAASTCNRLADKLEPFKDRINLLALQTDGTITSNGKTISPESTEIHLGWLNHDVISDDLTRPYAVSLLKSSSLEWMQSLSAGLDDPFFKMLAEKGIRLSNSDAQAPAIAEYVLASVLHRYQDFELRRQYQNDHKWQDNDFREIYGSNWMIIGLGNIGRLVADRVKAFNGNVLGVKRDKTQASDYPLINFDEIKTHLPKQDVIVLACALTDDTRGIVNQEFLQQMHPDSILVNIGRGDLVDEPALLNTLDSDAIDYAVLDVFATEPLPEDSAFWQHPRVLLTPHASNRGNGTKPRGEALFFYNLDAYLSGTPLKNEVDTTMF